MMKNITVKEFIEAGHRFVKGDSFISDDGELVKVESGRNVNQPYTDECDAKSYVAYAKCLDKQSPGEPEWDGNGLPPVGTDCDITFKTNFFPHECTILAITEKLAIIRYREGSDECAVELSRVDFHRSKESLKRSSEKAEAELREVVKADPDSRMSKSISAILGYIEAIREAKEDNGL